MSSHQGPKNRANRGRNDEFPRPFGRYVLLRQIGAGGMGEVFGALARHAMGVERLCAVKTIRPELAGHRQFRDRFREEARISVSMAHPNVIGVHEVGKVDATYYIAMELVEGYDLGRVVSRARRHNRPMSMQAALYVVRELLAALDYSHRHTDAYGNPLQLVHRDVSPANVLVSFDGRVRLADFGLALSGIRAKTESRVWGKPGYVAPERLLGRQSDRRVDIYAVGVLLQELLTGDPFVRSTEPALVVREAKNRQLTAPSLIRREVPRDVDMISLRAVAWNPNDRFTSAREFHDAIQSALVRIDPIYGARHLADEVMNRLFDGASWRAPLLEALEEAKSVQGDERSVIFTFAGSSFGSASGLVGTPTPAPTTSARPATQLSAGALELKLLDVDRDESYPRAKTLPRDLLSLTPTPRPSGASQVAGVVDVPSAVAGDIRSQNDLFSVEARLRRPRRATPAPRRDRPQAVSGEVRDEHPSASEATVRRPIPTRPSAPEPDPGEGLFDDESIATIALRGTDSDAGRRFFALEEAPTTARSASEMVRPVEPDVTLLRAAMVRGSSDRSQPGAGTMVHTDDTDPERLGDESPPDETLIRADDTDPERLGAASQPDETFVRADDTDPQRLRDTSPPDETYIRPDDTDPQRLRDTSPPDETFVRANDTDLRRLDPSPPDETLIRAEAIIANSRGGLLDDDDDDDPPLETSQPDATIVDDFSFGADLAALVLGASDPDDIEAPGEDNSDTITDGFAFDALLTGDGPKS